MKVTFDSDTHTYTCDGEIVPSVTEITRFLHYEAAYADKESRDRAARRGTAVHEATALIDYGEEVEVDNEILGYVQAWRAFVRDYHVKIIEIERMICGRVFANGVPQTLCGTMDRLAEIEGKTCIIDIKTGSKINKLALQAQLSAYAYLWVYCKHDPRVKLIGVQVKKDGAYSLYQPDMNHKLVETLYELHIAEKESKKRWKATV